MRPLKEESHGSRPKRQRPPPRLKRHHVPLNQFWVLLKQHQRDRILATLSRVVAKQLTPPPKDKEVGDE